MTLSNASQRQQDNALTPEQLRAFIRSQADKDNLRSRSGDDVKQNIRSAEIAEERRNRERQGRRR